ncbi:hypothetical protein LMK08_12220 [Metapseudomonas furukawaii]|uniref:hypothetical protein n=1 Tax=Metapseudomonas furukawaii TaxID=1149133 RepID=UPI00227A3580|nr:hypothetical protein [Pseudomonas furukawaii]WAG81384.1 hypothetical protein LMK08_12220 [Pseudomonas furukawaii]
MMIPCMWCRATGRHPEGGWCLNCGGKGYVDKPDPKVEFRGPGTSSKRKQEKQPKAPKKEPTNEQAGYLVLIVLGLTGAWYLGWWTLRYLGVYLSGFGPWETLGITFGTGLGVAAIALAVVYFALRWLIIQALRLWQRTFRKR